MIFIPAYNHLAHQFELVCGDLEFARKETLTAQTPTEVRFYLVAMTTDTDGSEVLLGCYDDRHLRRWRPTWLLWRPLTTYFGRPPVGPFAASKFLKAAMALPGPTRPTNIQWMVILMWTITVAQSAAETTSYRLSCHRIRICSFCEWKVAQLKNSHTPNKSQQLLPHWQCNTNRTIL